MYALDPLLLSRVDGYNWLFMSQTTLQVKQVVAPFESTKCAASLVKGTTKEEVLMEVSYNGVFKERLRKLLSDARN